MQTSDLQAAVAALRAGGLIAYPTEAVFGLGCDPRNTTALRKLLALKRRDHTKGLIIISCNYSQLVDFMAPHGASLARRLRTSETRPTTWVVDAVDALSPLLTGGRAGIAVRITAHPVAAALCRQFGSPIVSTSANLSHHPPATSAAGVRARFPAAIDTIVDSAVGKWDRPTSIIDARTGVVLR